ncbi:hypothetical protein CI102_14184 [Trichoderma harzianum]|nr:hypothetical protein CI102_14184 [Trichoderma harzianum]
MCFISSLFLLLIWLSITFYIYSFMTLGSSKKRNLFLVPRFFSFWDNVIWAWFGLAYREIGGGGGLGRGRILLRNGMDVFTDNEASSPTKFTTVSA